jgi:hypothetical protein
VKTSAYWQAVGAATFLILSGSELRAASPPPSAAAADPKPFLSAATKLVTTDPTKKTSEVRIRPTKDAVEAPFYDAAFAINIPVEMRHEGGPARVMWRVTVSWDNPPKEWPDSHWNLGGGNIGLYRMDGRSLEQAKFKSWVGQKWEGDAPLPTVVFNLQQKFTEAEKAKHQPFEKGTGDSFLMNPAEPGWYAIWYACGSVGWPEKEPKRDVLTGTIHIDTLVSRGEEEPTKAEVEYLAGRGKRPERMQEDKFYKLATTDLPFKLRRDGWVFDHAELRPLEKDKIEKKRILLGPKQSVYRTFTCVEKVGGTDVDMGVTEKIQADPRVPVTDAPIPDQDSLFETVYLVESNWKASFPSSLPDNSFGILKFTGKQQQRFQQKPAGQTQTPATSFRWEPLPPGKVINEKTNEEEKVGEHQTWGLLPMEKSAESGKEEIRKKFLNDFGPDATEWFVPGFFQDKMGGPKEGEPPYQYVIRGRYPPRKSAEVSEIGAYALLGYQIGPWQLLGYYKRQSEVEGRTVASKATAGEATIVSDTDDFWIWFVQFAMVLQAEIPKGMEAQVHATHAATPLQALIKSRDRLLLSLQEEKDPVLRNPIRRVWNSKAQVWDWVDNEFPKLNLGTVPGGSEPGSVNKPVKASPEMVERVKKKTAEISAQINEHRQVITQATTAAVAAYQKINDKLEEGNQRFGGPAHGELYLWRQHFREALERIPIEIALASKDPEMVRRALEKSANEGSSANVRVLEAELFKASGDAVSAVEALRRAVALDHNHLVAQSMLADAECAFLQIAIEKSQGAIAKARQHFYGYLNERGFADRDILATPRSRLEWLTTRIGIYGEEVWAVFTTGLFGSMSALVDREGGKPAAEADILATKEKEMTTAFIGLHTMRLLRKKGVTFEEMKKLQSFELPGKLGMLGRNGKPLSAVDAANLGVAIREAMKLPDVQALVSGDREGLEAGIKEGYWDSKDVSDTWTEWYGDITSPYNLFTIFLPFAKAGTAGRTMSPLIWTKAETAMIGELQTLGHVTSGTEAVAGAIGLTRQLNALGATAGGKQVINFMRGLESYQAGLGAFDKAVWTTGKITGALTFGYVTVSATEKLAGHKAAMLVGAAMMFAMDTDLLLKLLEARNIPPRAIGSLIISEYMPATKLHIKRLAATELTAGELRGLFERVTQGNRLVQTDYDFLNKYFNSDWRKLIPGPLASENATIALLAAAEGARAGVNNGALKAVEELKPGLTAEGQAAALTLQEEQKVADALNATITDPNPPIVEQPATPPRGPPVVERPITTKFGDPKKAVAELSPPPKVEPVPATPEYPPSSQRILPDETRAAAGLGPYLIHPPVRETSRTAEAMQQLNNARTRGQYAAAERKFSQIQDLIRQGVVTEAEEMTMERLHVYRMAANDLQRPEITRKFPTGRSTINDPIPPGTVDQVLDTPGLLKQIKDSSGAMSEVFNVEGRPELFVKRVRKDFKRYNKEKMAMEPVEINVLEDVENNLIHEQLARAMGFDVPATEVRIVYNAKGEAVEAYYVMRKVEGRVLADMTAGEIYLYREELARHRALATLMGDFDRKLDNYIITKDGHFVPIDAGMGDASGERLIRECTKEGIEYRADMPFTIDGFYGRDHWYAKAVAKTPGKELLTTEKTAFRKLLLAEESMTFQGAEAIVIEIESYFVTGAKAAKAEELIGEAYRKMLIEKNIKRLAELKGVNSAEPAVRAVLLQEVLANPAIQGQISDAVQKVKRNFNVRAPHLRDSMKGLNKRNGIPVFETDLGFSTPLHLDSDFIFRFTLQHFLTTTFLRRAA